MRVIKGIPRLIYPVKCFIIFFIFFGLFNCFDWNKITSEDKPIIRRPAIKSVNVNEKTFVDDYDDVDEHEHIFNVSSLLNKNRNNTDPWSIKLMIYNRVPKCGSSTAQSLLRKLSYRNYFKHRSSHVYDDRNMTDERQSFVLNKLLKKSRRYRHSYDKHMYFFDKIKMPPEVTWFNIVRNPVSRLISHYYYIRSPTRWKKNRSVKTGVRPPDSWFNRTLDECVEQRDPECWPVDGRYFETQLTYFCGSHPDCRDVRSREGFRRAKKNIEKYYSIVAVLEEFPKSFKVMEKLLPNYFNEVATLYSGEEKRQNSYKPPTSQKTKALLSEVFHYDVELYEFIKQRLDLQYRELRK